MRLSPSLLVSIPLAALVSSACGDTRIGTIDRPPQVTFVRPVDGVRFEPGTAIDICVYVDDEDPLSDMQVRLESSADGVISESPDDFAPCEGGSGGLQFTPTAAVQSLSILVIDRAGNAGTAALGLAPDPNSAPACELSEPESPSNVEIGEPLRFIATATDAESAASELTAILHSNVDGEVWSGAPDSAGRVDFALSNLASGYHTLTLTITDPRALSADCVAFVFVDPCLDADRDGFTTCDGDCHDDADDAYPGGLEQPDGLDNDCDGTRDEGTILYDDDGDGFSELQGDCDDTNPAFHPDAIDLPGDGVDQNCSGYDALNCFRDADADGVGGPLAAVVDGPRCEATGTSGRNDDCDDNDPTIRPGATEIPADGIDQDCSGSDSRRCFVDADGDGWGSDNTLISADLDCTDLGEAERSGDCAPNNGTIHPGAAEVLDDGIDQDCDGNDGASCFVDADRDGHGSSVRITSNDGDCTAPGLAPLPDDCDDTNAARKPGAIEIPDDGIDQDCSGSDAVTCFVDRDLDRYGTTETMVSLDNDCADPGESPNDDDCDDTNNAIQPGASDAAFDGLDQNCDGVPGVDADGDGFASRPSGGTDCDDGDNTTHPGAPELRDNEDNDCDGLCDEGRIVVGDLIVSEMMIDPNHVADEQGEWFEVHNPTTTDVRMCGGWRLTDEPSGAQEVANLSEEVLVPAGGYAIFARSGDSARNGGLPSPDFVYGNALILANGADEIFLEFNGLVIDEVRWTSAWPQSGRALALRPGKLTATDNNTLANWGACTVSWRTPSGGNSVDKGTPGLPNNACFP